LSQSIRRSQKDHLLVFVTAEAFSAGFLSVATSFPGVSGSASGIPLGLNSLWFGAFFSLFNMILGVAFYLWGARIGRLCFRRQWAAVVRFSEAWQKAARQRALRSNGFCCKAWYGERWKSHRSPSEGFIFWQCSPTAIVMHGAATSLGKLVPDGSRQDRHQPVFVHHEVQLVSAGWYHSLATLQTGETVAWGRNNCGQLGDGTRTDRTRPVPVLGPMALEGTKLMNAEQLAAGQDHSLAIVQVPGHGKSVVYGWGANVGKPVADEDRFTMVSPDVLYPQALIVVRIPSAGVELASSRASQQPLGLEDIVQISAGTSRHWGVVCVGSARTDMASSETVAPSLARSREDGSIVGLLFRKAIACPFHRRHRPCPCLPFLADSELGAKVVAQEEGWAREAPRTCRQAPTPVLEGVKSVVAGHCHCFALLESGECLGWGVNQHGCVRVGGDPEILAPVKVDLKEIVEIKAGDGTTLARLSNGEYAVWGRNWQNQIACLNDLGLNVALNWRPSDTVRGEVAVESMADSSNYDIKALMASKAALKEGRTPHGAAEVAAEFAGKAAMEVARASGASLQEAAAAAGRAAANAARTAGMTQGICAKLAAIAAGRAATELSSDVATAEEVPSRMQKRSWDVEACEQMGES
ncbi:UVR8, partial [Symbiodinium necroappetens]